MKNPYILLLIFALSLGVNTDTFAQKRGKKKRKNKNETEEVQVERAPLAIKEKLNLEFKVGNVTLGNQFRIAMKGNAGYKFTNYFSTGLALKYDYTFVNQTQSDDISFSHYGVGVYGRLKFLQDFYVQVEYDYNDMQKLERSGGGTFIIDERLRAFAPLIGGGYFSGFGDWRFGVEVLFVAGNEVRDNLNSVIEYWLGASYNF